MSESIYPGDTIWLSKEFNVKAVYYGRIKDFFVFIPLGSYCPFSLLHDADCKDLGLEEGRYIIMGNQSHDTINDFKFEKYHDNGFVSDWKVYEEEKPCAGEEVLAYNKRWATSTNPGFRIGFENKKGKFVTSTKVENREHYSGMECTNNPKYWKELTILTNMLP